jgi:hypothetical protein
MKNKDREKLKELNSDLYILDSMLSETEEQIKKLRKELAKIYDDLDSEASK